MKKMITTLKKSLSPALVGMWAIMLIFTLASAGTAKGQNVYVDVQSLANGLTYTYCDTSTDTVFVYQQSGLGGTFGFRILPGPVQSSTADTLKFISDFNISMPGVLQWTYHRFVDSVGPSGITSQDFCGGAPMTLHAGDSANFPTYLWSTGETTESIVTNVSGAYWIQKTGACNVITDSFVLNFIAPQAQLCVARFDPTTQKNELLWDGSNLQGDFFIIQKRNISNTMEAVDTVSFATGTWIDYASNPQGDMYEYAGVIIDTCGNTSDTSVHHKTMWVQISQFGGATSFTLTAYVGANPAPQTVTLYGIRSNSQVDSIKSIASSFLSTSIPDSVAQDYVKFYFGFPVSCGSAKGIIEMRSNVVTNPTSSISEVTEYNISLYPNPTTGIINIAGVGEVTVNVYDYFSRLVVSEAGMITTIDLGAYATGIYFVKIITETGVYTQKVIKK